MMLSMYVLESRPVCVCGDVTTVMYALTYLLCTCTVLTCIDRVARVLITDDDGEFRVLQIY